MTQIFGGKERPDSRFALEQTRASEQLESQIMEKAGAVVSMKSFPGLRINSPQIGFLALGCPVHKPALPAPGRPTPPHSISRALGIMMDGGDMLNYSDSVSSSSW